MGIDIKKLEEMVIDLKLGESSESFDEMLKKEQAFHRRMWKACQK